MSSLFKNIRSKGNTGSPSTTSPNKKDPPVPLTPLEKLLQDAPPLKDDGRDRFFGLENFGSTCYGSSILQCLFYSIPFREEVINFPVPSIPEKVLKGADGSLRLVPTVPFPQTPEQLAKAKAQAAANTTPPVARTSLLKPEDKDSQEYKKKQVLSKGPLWALRYDNASNYGMKESLFTCMKDLFEAISMNQARMGIIAPYKFYEIMRSSIHETWGGSQHQDAHEFLNLLLNSVVDTVEATAKSIENVQGKDGVVTENGTISQAIDSLERQTISGQPTKSRWVHELFEGILTSETKCLSCESTSKRDEPFLDLSVDLDAHSSVTACLKRFSQEEMLKERDKFFCDNCGGLQEAEKRMKIKRLPKILALHLKRFRYTEDMQRMNKLFHRVSYPEQLRLFNTTIDAEDPDRIYELYAVVVHIGAGPYHGHYVSIIKTKERGWLLFDDELVEPVDKSFVMKFFGDKGNLACAYVLFYQETTAEAVKAEQEAEGRAAVAKMTRVVPPVKESHGFGLGLNLKTNGFMSHQVTSPTSPTEELASAFPALNHAMTEPQVPSSTTSTTNPLVHTKTISSPQSPSDTTPTRKARKLQEKEAAKTEKIAAKEAKASRKDEDIRLRQPVKTNVMDDTKSNEKTSREKDTPSWNFLSAMNQSMSSTANPTVPMQQGGTIPAPIEQSATSFRSSENHPLPIASPVEAPLTKSITSYSTIPTPSASTVSTTTTTTSSSPNTTTSPNSAGGSGVGSSAFSRFRQTSRSLKHRPKFWPGSSSSASASGPSSSVPNPPPPLPPAPTSNGHSFMLPAQAISDLTTEKKSDEFALEDSDTGSATGAGELLLSSAIPRSTVSGTSADDGIAGGGGGGGGSKKRASRFSLRRKGSNMLA